MQHFYRNVPGLGNVAVSRHAQQKMLDDGVSEHTFVGVLFAGETVPDGLDVVKRRGQGIEIVVLLNPKPTSGAKLVKTVYRQKPVARTRG